VRLFGTSTYGRQEILILEYLSEGALSRHLSDDDKRKRLYPSVRIRVMYKIALALHCLRNEGEKYHLLHGDVKSANICLDGDFSPKLIDWGLSKIKVVEGRDQFLSIAPTMFNNHNDGAGTFGYMCPKYKQGLIDEYEGACDVYSFGVVMFELITGRLVAEGDLVQMYKTAEKLSENVDPIFAGAWSGALFDLCQLALSCVEYELTDRPSLEDIILKLSCIRIKFKESRREKLKSIIQRVIQKARNGDIDVDTQEPQDDLPSSTETTSACHECSSLIPMNEESSNRAVDLEMIHQMTAIKQRLALLEGSARDAEIQKLTEKLENLEKEADEAREFRRTVWKILTVVVTENHPCPRFVVVKPLSVDSSNWSFQRLLNNEAIVYFICERSYESVEAFKVKITHEWVKKAAPVLQITWEILKKGSAFMIPMGDILGGVADALVTMTTSLLQGGCPTFDPSFLIELATGTSQTGPVAGPSARHDMYEVTKGYYSTFAEMALQPENDAWRSKMCAVPSSEGGHKWVKTEYSQIIS
jgi:serine/threonine protein kinase